MRWAIERHGSVGSTMELADDRARSGAPAGVVIVASEQIEGRGQRGRQWLAPAGTSMLMTAVARPECQPNRLPNLPETIGRHVIQAIARCTGLECALKLPNDVMANGRKLAGVLCQSSIEASSVRYVLIGIGINVNIPASALPVDTATSLLVETGQEWDIDGLLQTLLAELEACWCFQSPLRD